MYLNQIEKDCRNFYSKCVDFNEHKGLVILGYIANNQTFCYMITLQEIWV